VLIRLAQLMDLFMGHYKMNVSYLTDAQVRFKYLELLESIDEMLDLNKANDDAIVLFWNGLGYAEHEIPEY
jgi:hypothetical protein